MVENEQKRQQIVIHAVRGGWHLVDELHVY